MPLVNLIAVRRAERRRANRRMRITALAWLIELTACLAIAGGLMWQVDRQDTRLADLRIRSQSMEPYKKMIVEGQKELGVLKPRLATLQQAGRSTDRWMRILEHLSTHVPEGTWLTSIRVQEAKNRGQPSEVYFVGFSVDQQRVGELMMELNKSEDLGIVQLRYTKEKESADGKGVEFEVFSTLSSAGGRPDKDRDNAGS